MVCRDLGADGYRFNTRERFDLDVDVVFVSCFPFVVRRMLSVWRKGVSLAECVRYKQKLQWNPKPKMRTPLASFPGLPWLQVLIACSVLQNLGPGKTWNLIASRPNTSLQCKLTTK